MYFRFQTKFADATETVPLDNSVIADMMQSNNGFAEKRISSIAIMQENSRIYAVIFKTASTDDDTELTRDSEKCFLLPASEVFMTEKFFGPVSKIS